MTNLEHYIENAICYLENNGTYEDFFNQKLLKLGEEQTGISLKDMWEMAQYIVYSYKPCIVRETEERVENKYGYKLDD